MDWRDMKESDIASKLERLLDQPDGLSKVAWAMKAPIEAKASLLTKCEIKLSNSDEAAIKFWIAYNLKHNKKEWRNKQKIFGLLDKLKNKLVSMLVQTGELSLPLEFSNEFFNSRLCHAVNRARQEYERTGGVPATDLIQKYK
jgi:hypothetical protein